MLQIKVTQVLDRAAFFLNDVNRAYFTDTILMPPFLTAYDDLQQYLLDNNFALMNETSETYTIEAGKHTDIGGPTGPPLPVDFIVPFNVWERLYNTQNDYDLMVRKNFLPKTEILTNALCFWQYNNQYIKFIGANTDRNVKIDYMANNLSIAEDPEGLINTFNAASYLSYRTAALAARYLAENKDRSADLDNDAQANLDSLINVDVKSKQNIQTRRIGAFQGRTYGRFNYSN